jgi:hypothetical protein
LGQEVVSLTVVAATQNSAKEREEFRIFDVVSRPFMVTCSIRSNIVFCISEVGPQGYSSVEQCKFDWIAKELHILTAELHIVTVAVGGSIGVDGYL